LARSSCRSRNRGLSLLEVVVAVGILAAGIVTVLQALSYSARFSAVAGDITNAAFLAEDTLQELEFKESRNQTVGESKSGEVAHFRWEYAAQYNSDLQLYTLNYAVRWNRLKIDEDIMVDTFLKNIK